MQIALRHKLQLVRGQNNLQLVRDCGGASAFLVRFRQVSRTGTVMVKTVLTQADFLSFLTALTSGALWPFLTVIMTAMLYMIRNHLCKEFSFPELRDVCQIILRSLTT